MRQRPSKGACLTCKMRKVKCDEARPACNRCVSTGRVCDGYGIWGGGGNSYLARQCKAREACEGLTNPPREICVLTSNASEKLYLDWFLCRARKRLPGPFALEFWRNLVVQASGSESAVLHAVLSLSAAHRRDHCDGYGQITAMVACDEQERFMLKHYVQAISELRPQLESADRATVRVVLIICLLFMSLELLRGHFHLAQVHFDRGIPIARMLSCAHEQSGSINSSLTLPEPTDSTILQAFSRLQLHAELFHSTHPHEFALLPCERPLMCGNVFNSNLEAWNELESLLHDCISLTQKSQEDPPVVPANIDTHTTLLVWQRVLQVKLGIWSFKLHASKGNLSATDFKEGVGKEFVMHYFLAWHTMISIMAVACLDPWNTSVYDAPTDSFAIIVQHCTDMHSKRLQTTSLRALPGYLIDMSRSSVDIGWLPPLYFTALRCCKREIRLQAIELMESISHREGIWDSKICAKVARLLLETVGSVGKVKVELTDDVRAGIRVTYTEALHDHWRETWVLI